MELGKVVIFFVGLMVAVCSGLPASRTDDVELVNPVKTYGDQPIVDTGIFSGWESPFSSNPFGGIFDNLESIMERMRQQIASLINRFPLAKGGNATEGIFPGGFAGFPSISGIDLSKGNTTSVTKVIDGHTVVINETEYKKEDDFGGTFFKVRIVDVKPDSSELTTEKEAEPLPEDVTNRIDNANSIENEIAKSKEVEVIDNGEDNTNLFDNLQKSNLEQFSNLETFDETETFYNTPSTSTTHEQNLPSIKNEPTWNEWSNEDVNPEWSYISPVKPVDSNTIESRENELERQLPIDLSRDTYVNEILAMNGAPIDPDAEVFIVGDIREPNLFQKGINPR